MTTIKLPHDEPLEACTFHDLRYWRRPAKEEPATRLHFAHATGFHGFTYAPLFEHFADDVEVHAVDLRGHGGSRAGGELSRFHSWQHYADDLVRWLDDQEQPVLMAGHSVGGTTSLFAAIRRPERVAGLLLLEPVILSRRKGLALALMRLARQHHRLPIAAGAARRKATFESHEAAFARFEGRGAFKTWPRPFLERYVQKGLVPDPDGGVRLACDPAWESRSFSLTPADPLRGIRRLTCPVTVLTGATDSRCSERSIRAIRRALPDVRALCDPETTHFLPMEKPGWVAEELERLQARVASGVSRR